MTVDAYLRGQIGDFATDTCYKILRENNCTLKITKPRKTKLGDFRVRGKVLQITLNYEENKYRFILTLVHEVAHLLTHVQFGRRVNPHGGEWKNKYREVFDLLKLKEVFISDERLEKLYFKELQNPSVCSGRDMETELILNELNVDPTKEAQVLVGVLSCGTTFIFRNKTFQKLADRRTKALCKCVETNKTFLVPKAAFVEVLGRTEVEKQEHILGQIRLQDVKQGGKFTFNNRVFIKEKDRRSRSLCKCTQSGKMYTIHQEAEVELI